MRICYVVDAIGLHSDRIAAEMARRNHEIHVIAQHGYSRTAIYRIHYAPIPEHFRLTPRSWLWASVPKTIRIIESIKPDIVHGIYIPPTGLSVLLSPCRSKVLTGLGSDYLILPRRDPFVRVISRLSLRFCDLVTIPSEATLSQIIDLGARPEAVRTLPLGVQPEFLLEDRTYRTKPFKIISTRNLEPIYNLDCLIRALPTVIGEYPETIVRIAGKGSQESHLKSMVQDLGVGDSVNFLGHLDVKDLARVLSESHMYVSTSLSDSLGISTLEAMARGCIPVLSDIPVNNELVKDKWNGRIYGGKPEELGKALIECMNDYDMISGPFIERNRELVRQKYLWRDNMDRLEGFYRALLERK